MNIDWNTRYERTMNHTYMVLSKCDFFTSVQEEKTDYRVRMLLENRIPGILPVTHRKQDGEEGFYYEINSLQSMSQLYEKEEIGVEALEILLHGCIRVFEKLEEYLLDGAQILLHPDYIYIHPDTKEPFFTYYPESDIDVRDSFVSFVDYLLARLDHTQEKAVMLGYQVYRYTRNPNFVLSEITQILSEHAQHKSACKHVLEDRNNKYERVAIQREKDRKAETEDEEAVYDEWKEDIEFINVQREDREEVNNRQYRNTEEHETARRSTTNRLMTELLQIGKKEFIGVLVSIGVTCVSCLALFVIRVLEMISIPYIYELYLCGILAMALVAAAMFAYSLYKKRQEWKEICQLQGGDDSHILVEHRSACMLR